MFVAKIIGAVYIVLAWGVAFFALAHDFVRNGGTVEAHYDASVKDVERAFEVFVGIFFHVGHDATEKLIDFFEAIFHKEAGGFFAAHAAGAHRHDRFIAEVFQRGKHGGEIAKVFKLWVDGAFKATDSIFIVVAHVDDVKLFGADFAIDAAMNPFMQLFRSEVFAGNFVGINVEIFEGAGDNFVAHLHRQARECVARSLTCFKVYVFETRLCSHGLNVALGVFG